MSPASTDPSMTVLSSGSDARAVAPADWVRVDGRYSHRQGRAHYEMTETDHFEARVFALPRRYVGGRPSFTERFGFDIVGAGARRGAGAGEVVAVASNESPLRTIKDAKAAAAGALSALP